MWNYEKRLQYPVKITQTNPKIAKIIISQFGMVPQRRTGRIYALSLSKIYYAV